ncbi:GerAB/ArcD/ProY family transporter [Paenibacillus sp. y28]|uniref:GerAB/ArcD/ProY family transporter n=1 Tax=Paenibacillus sp. y28 TaxID=3129110 RepID=UPI00301B17ED
MKRSEISPYQFFFIIFVSITSLTFFSVPNQLVSKVKQDLWLSVLLGMLIDSYVAYLLYRLGLMYPGQSLIQYTNTIFGKLGRAVNLLYILFFLGVMVTALWIYSDFLTRTLMPDTPREVFAVTMTLCAGAAAIKGVETIARLSQLIGVLILLASFILFASSIPYLHLNYMLPVFENGLMPAIKGAIYPGSWFGICIMMGMIMPHLSRPTETFKMKVMAVALGSFVMTLYLVYCIMVMGTDMASQFQHPVYVFARITQFIIFERIEVLLFLSFISGSFITISMVYYAAAQGAAQLFRTRSHKKWVYAFGAVLMFSPMLPLTYNSSLVNHYLSFWFPVVSLSIEGGLTTVLFFTAFIRIRMARK